MTPSHTLNSKNKTQNPQSPAPRRSFSALAPRRSFSGFTLIELLIVIVVIGIVVSLAVVGLSRVRIASRDDKRVADISCIQKALEMYYNDNGSYPAAITPGQPMVGPTSGLTYIKAVPASSNKLDGSCATDTYTYTYVSASDYTLTYCLGGKVADIAAGNCTAKPGNMCAVATVTDTGWVYAGTLANVAILGNAWTNASNAATTNGSYASQGGFADSSVDYRVRLVKNNSISDSERKQTASPSGAWAAAPDQTITYGTSNTDLWGEASLSYAEVTASDFGFAVAVDINGASYTDYLKATNFDLSSIPASATIQGVQAQIVRHAGLTSFLAGTQINTPTGSKNIESIKEGDIVLAYDYTHRQIVPTKVLSLRQSQSDYLIIKTGSREMQVTPQHEIYVGQNKYKSAQDFKIGDWLIIGEDGELSKEQIRSIEKKDNKVEVYNFETDIYHNYLANGIIVHNPPGAQYSFVDSMAIKVYYTN